MTLFKPTTWNKSRLFLLYCLIFIIVAIFLDLHHYLFLPPQGIHFIRQTDGLSIASNYFHFKVSFFEPQVYNLSSTDGKGGVEFPVLYYLTSLTYKVFGEHEFILRFFSLLLVALGHYYLFRLVKDLLNDSWFGLLFSFWFLSSTILLYYAVNFLPDPAAYAFTLIGWYYGFKWIRNKQLAAILLSGILFTLAGLLKVSTLINPLALLLLFIIKILITKDIKNFSRKLFQAFTFVMICCFSVVILWYIYVIWYNQQHHNLYFLTAARPVWSLQHHEISEVLEYITGYWYSKYYYQSTFHAFIIILIPSVFLYRSFNKTLALISLLITLGSLSFFLLFFAQFKDHDYYFITLVPAIIFLVINSFLAIKTKFPAIVNHLGFRIALLLMVCLSLNYARLSLGRRFSDTNDYLAASGLQLKGAAAFLEQRAIPRQCRFLVIPDPTPNGSLYFLQRKGWTIADSSQGSIFRLDRLIPLADYLVVCDSGYISKVMAPGLRVEKTWDFNGAVIFRLNK